MGCDGGLCDGGRRQAADRGIPGWDGDLKNAPMYKKMSGTYAIMSRNLKKYVEVDKRVMNAKLLISYVMHILASKKHWCKYTRSNKRRGGDDNECFVESQMLCYL